jgi:hypothetical protein
MSNTGSDGYLGPSERVLARFQDCMFATEGFRRLPVAADPSLLLCRYPPSTVTSCVCLMQWKSLCPCQGLFCHPGLLISAYPGYDILFFTMQMPLKMQSL